ncbi:MAG TPA: hypothetical protein VLL72_05995, partial [Kiloniellales bacterium]|nr:hypothetical protein [Kiloniellales bacterium]
MAGTRDGGEDSETRGSPHGGVVLVVTMCLAEIASMLGFGSFPALQPIFFAEWRLTNTEAGWINGIYFGAYMAAVPVLVALTDRIDPRRIY